MVVCPGRDLDLARAAVQFEREDRAGSCAAAYVKLRGAHTGCQLLCVD